MCFIRNSYTLCCLLWNFIKKIKTLIGLTKSTAIRIYVCINVSFYDYTEPQYTLSNSHIPSFDSDFFNYSCCAFIYVSFSILLVSADTRRAPPYYWIQVQVGVDEVTYNYIHFAFIKHIRSYGYEIFQYARRVSI